jgi:hypothetical protein
MSRVYTCTFSGTFTQSGGDVDWLAIKPAANKPVRLRGLVISQISEVGDSAEEGLMFGLLRLPATVSDGSGGGSVTLNPLDENDSAAGASARANDTTLTTSSSTILHLDDFGWNERNTPFERWWPDDKFAPRVQNAGALVLRQFTTLADDMFAIVTAYLEEY